MLAGWPAGFLFRLLEKLSFQEWWYSLGNIAILKCKYCPGYPSLTKASWKGEPDFPQKKIPPGRITSQTQFFGCFTEPKISNHIVLELTLYPYGDESRTIWFETSGGEPPPLHQQYFLENITIQSIQHQYFLENIAITQCDSNIS